MLNLKNIKKELLSGDILGKVASFFGRNIKKFVFMLFFISALYCGYLWYSFVYNPTWSTEKEEAYLKTKEKEVTFNRKKFQDIVEKERQRAEEYVKTVSEANDIFRIDQAQSEQKPQESQPSQEAQSIHAL